MPEHRVLEIREPVLGRNDEIAAGVRGDLERAGVFALNLLSSPGAGKTALLEATLTAIVGRLRAAVIVGDLQTDNDARRLAGRGAATLQVVTGDICHLDASMVRRALDQMGADGLDLLFLENVGNLVCPAAFDIGERRRVALLSVTEGEDKPRKYPTLFRTADLVLITKMDIAKYVDFDIDIAMASIVAVAPDATVLQISSRTGLGMDAWLGWLDAEIAELRTRETGNGEER